MIRTLTNQRRVFKFCWSLTRSRDTLFIKLRLYGKHLQILNGLFVTHSFTTSTGGLSSSSDEYSSPIPNQQINPNHQFSPTNPYNRQRQANGMPQNPQYNQYPQYTSSISPIRGVAADPLGNLFILPKQLDVGLCHGCRNAPQVPSHHVSN